MAKGRVLVVEDDAQWRELILRKRLEAGGYEVLAIAEYEALEQHLRPGAFDVAVVDIGLSQRDYTNVDGMQVIADIARLDPEIPIIVVSGRAAEGMRIDAPEFHRTVAFFQKEAFSRREFFAALERALALRVGQASD